MKELKGSERQIAWAEDIRNKAIEALNSVVDYYNEKQLDGFEKVAEEIQPGIDKLMSVIANVEDASYIIEHRNELNPQKMKSNLASAVETERAKKAVSMLIR